MEETRNTKYACDCDRVIEMEEMGIGVEEILQYARGVLEKDDLQTLIRGLEEMSAGSSEEADGEEDG